MIMTKEYLGGKINSITYHLDFSYELEKRYKKCIGMMITVTGSMNDFMKKGSLCIMSYQKRNSKS
jgi:hypothetical protein